jgi:enoyl-CoA hydratase/carnithine racemase
MEAEWHGLVHRVVRPEELELAARDTAAGIAAASATAIRGGLEYVRASRGRNVEEAGEIARRTREDVFRSAEFREGIRAFREKRKAG